MDNIHMLFGAPGCGKTTRLMAILEQELKRNVPEQIAFVSFTRKGTYEGVERAKVQCNYKEAELPFFRTLHSIAFRVGNFSKYDMISRSDYRAFSEAMGMKFTGYYTEEFYSNDDKYLFTHFMKRNNPVLAESYLHEMNVSKLAEVEHNFNRYKKHANVHDFTDLIEHFINVGEPLPVNVAIIDEAQDLTTLQWRMCEVAFSNCQRIYIAGDDDQAIYEWSGADVNYFLNINANKREILDQSYRLQKNVLTIAKTITKQISKRVDKQFEPIGDQGEVFVYNSLDELKLNTDESWYFLSRNNWFLQHYDNYLRKQARVFTHKEVASVDTKHFDAITTFEAARKHGKLTDVDDLKLKLLLKPDYTLSTPWYDNFNLPNDTLAYYRDLVKYRASLTDAKLHVDTIHGVKGGEADNVVLMLDYTRAVKNNMQCRPDAELRCLYVALTRAKKNLHIIYSSTKNGYDDCFKEHQFD